MVVAITWYANIVIPLHGEFTHMEAIPPNQTITLSNQALPTSSGSDSLDVDYNSPHYGRGSEEG